MKALRGLGKLLLVIAGIPFALLVVVGCAALIFALQMLFGGEAMADDPKDWVRV